MNCNSSGTAAEASPSLVTTEVSPAANTDVVTASATVTLLGLEAGASPASGTVEVEDAPPHEAKAIATIKLASARRDVVPRADIGLGRTPTDLIMAPYLPSAAVSIRRAAACFAKVSSPDCGRSVTLDDVDLRRLRSSSGVVRIVHLQEILRFARKTVAMSFHPRLRFVAAAPLALMLLVSCDESTTSSQTTAAVISPTSAGAATTAPTQASTTVGETTTTSAAAASSTTAAAATDTIVNTWSGAIVDPTALPIGDAFVSTDGPSVGGLWACNAGNPNAGGASADGPWINSAAGTWDSTNKLAVEGEIVWEAAQYTETVTDGSRLLTSNDLPVEDPTGNFPIDTGDPAFQYDRNPGTITEQSVSITLPQFGTEAAAPSCMSEGEVGMLRNGVYVFNSLDGRGDDAVAHELQDLCDGHPAMTTYHYHNVPSCIRDKATGPSTVVGFAYDGFPIVVERDATGALPTNADLDQCHGRTSPVLLDGEIVTTYHYSATLEFPYFIGCYTGTSVKTGR